jgi:hypothetical protein
MYQSVRGIGARRRCGNDDDHASEGIRQCAGGNDIRDVAVSLCRGGDEVRGKLSVFSDVVMILEVKLSVYVEG